MEAEDADVAQERTLAGFEDSHSVLNVFEAGGEPPDESVLRAPLLWQPLRHDDAREHHEEAD